MPAVLVGAQWSASRPYRACVCRQSWNSGLSSSCVRRSDVVTVVHASPVRHCCTDEYQRLQLGLLGDSGTMLPSTMNSRYPDDDITQPLTLHYIASTNKSYPSRNAPLLQHLKPVLIKYVQESNVHRLWYVYLTSTLSLA